MMRATRAAFSLLSHFISILLSYALLVSTLAPFGVRRADAAVRTEATSSAAVKLSADEGAPVGDGLVSDFGGEIAASDVNAPDAAQWPHQTPALVGESPLARIKALTGYNLESLTDGSRVNPVAGFSKSDFLTERNGIASLDPRFGQLSALKNANTDSTPKALLASVQATPSPTPRPSPTPVRLTPPFNPPGLGVVGARASDYRVTPPLVTTTIPGVRLPNLDVIRRLPNTVPTPPPQPTTASASDNLAYNDRDRHGLQCEECDLPCVDCDPGGGGSGPAPTGDPRYSTARTYPENETGEPNVDLGSRNFNWSAPILGLKGRAGLDLGLTLSYNSLVWVKQSAGAVTGIRYNADRGFPGPGFRLGFPMIHPRYTNSQVGTLAYMMVMPSGARIEMRRIGTTNEYVSADGTYTQMIDSSNGTDSGTALVKTTDGTQMRFVFYNYELRCTEIKDRNGNFISISYYTNGHVNTITDTLGRVVTFNYDGDHNLTSITQPWYVDG